MSYLAPIAGNEYNYPAIRKAMVNALRIMHGIPITVTSGEVVGYIEEMPQLEAGTLQAHIVPVNGNDRWIQNRIKGHRLELYVVYQAGGKINLKETSFKFTPNKPTNNKDSIE